MLLFKKEVRIIGRWFVLHFKFVRLWAGDLLELDTIDITRLYGVV